MADFELTDDFELGDFGNMGMMQISAILTVSRELT
jgi:hypothetical protein